MGDSRSWAADMEDEDKTCKFGVVTKYFDTCRCPGCEALRTRNERINAKAKEIYWIAEKVFRETPDDKWDSITQIKVK